MANRPNWRTLKIHRSYTIDEAARTLSVCKATVRRWIKDQGLSVIDERRPALLLGRDLIAFGKSRRRPKHKCGIDQAYCFSCRTPKNAAFGQMEIVAANQTSANVRMCCQTCSSVMHKRFAWRDLPSLSPLTHLTAQQDLRDLIDTIQPCLNVHFEKDE